MKRKFLGFLGYGAGLALLVQKSRPKVVSTAGDMVDGKPRPQSTIHQAPPAPKTPPADKIVLEGQRRRMGIFEILKRTYTAFDEDDCMTYGAAVAYYSVFSLPPLLLLLISVAGAVLGRAAVQGELQRQIGGVMGSGAASQVQTMVAAASTDHTGNILGFIFGGLALIFGATTAFVALQTALNKAWHVAPDPHSGGIKNFIGKRVLSFGLVLGLAFLLVVSLAVSAVIAAFGDWIGHYTPGAVSGALLHVAGILASFLVIGLLFAVLFKFLPDARVQWRDVWVGAGLTSALFTFGKTLIGIYLGKTGAVSAYGAAGSVMLIVLWLYYASLIFLLGAEFTRVWASARGRGIRPENGAVRVETEQRRLT